MSDPITQPQINKIMVIVSGENLVQFLKQRTELIKGVEVNRTRTDFEEWLAKNIDKHEASCIISKLEAYEDLSRPQVITAFKKLLVDIKYITPTDLVFGDLGSSHKTLKSLML